MTVAHGTTRHRILRPLSEWRPRHLFGAWVGYWIVALLIGIAPALPMLWRLANSGVHGKVIGAAGDGVVSLTIATGTQLWARTLSFGALTLLVVVPPLLLWLAWVIARPRRTD